MVIFYLSCARSALCVAVAVAVAVVLAVAVAGVGSSKLLYTQR